MLQFNTSGYECSYIQNLLYNVHVPTVPFYASLEEAIMNIAVLDVGDTFITRDSIYRVDVDKMTKRAVRTSSYVFGRYYPGITKNYISTNNYYNSDLHEQLGEYWRFYCLYHNVQLMGLYNCYSNRYADNISLPLRLNDLGEVVSSSDTSTKKVIAVKVKPLTRYKICLQGSDVSHIQCGLYDKKNLIQAHNPDNSASWIDTKLVAATLTYAVPFEYETPELKPELMQFERYFYMFITVDRDNIYPVVVVEDDATLIQNNSLLTTRVDTLQPVYSDKFFSYLCHHVITKEDTIHQNIAKVQSALGEVPTGIFTNDEIESLYSKYRFAGVADYTGFVDRDVEELLGLI